MRAKRVSISARSRAGIPRLTPQLMASDTARLGTMRHIERRARSLKESPPMEVFGSNYGLLRTSNLRSARMPRQSPSSDPRAESGKSRRAAPPEEKRPLLGSPEDRAQRAHS